MENISKILVLFKTHLDIGFTNHAQTVMERYREEYIPGALRTARELRESGGEERLVWTTGSFLVWDYLKHATPEQQEEMEEAIRQGDISWHGLPCTTHTELMNGPLFEYGLSLSKRLDERFGRQTIGAKMTDVPGHTMAIIPYMEKAGLRFLHLGVNPASTVPENPGVFRWQYEGSEIAVMYNNDYGRFTMIPGTETAVYFAHTGDNHGPQSAEQIRKIYRELAEEYPDAELVASDMNTLAEEVLKVWDNLPVFTKEIGDTWIHGVASDPGKIALYRELLREEPEWSDEERDAALDEILLVPEHTWGMDIKTHLHDHENYIRADFEKNRCAENYLRVEHSWQEQRDYLNRAIEALTPEHQKAVLEFKNQNVKPDMTGYEVVSDALAEQEAAGWTFRFDKNGAICKLSRGAAVYADETHLWGALNYKNDSPDEYEKFYETYVTNLWDWAREDFGKLGFEKAILHALEQKPVMTGLYKRENTYLALLEMNGPVHELYGAPGKLAAEVTFTEDEVTFSVSWWEKPACRVPEEIWCGFTPASAPEDCRVRKLGKWIDPLNVCNGGGLHLHATDYGVRWNGGELETLDTAVVSVGLPKVMPYTREPIHPEEGFYFNLENTIWGTNFVMWYEEDARFRWVFRPGEEQ